MDLYLLQRSLWKLREAASIMCKIGWGISFILFSASAFARGENKIDILGYGGYSQMNTFSNVDYNNSLGTLSGYNVGASLRYSITQQRVSPVLGVGSDYVALTSSPTFGGVTYTNTYTSTIGIGYLGLRFMYPRFTFFLLGEGGYGLADSLKIVSSIGNTNISTENITLKNHFLYGGSVNILVRISSKVKLGIIGFYHLHSTDLQNTLTNTTVATTYNEYSGNVAIDFTL